ncbi:MAG: hypothetical protein MJ094_06960 [Saccharofermentans sp.]|nr:hypothetical protein [Saccharofermentans sp.]
MVYSAFGLTIDSELELLAPLSEGAIDLRITYGQCPADIDDKLVDFGWVKTNKYESLVIIENVARFYVTNGNRIVIEKLGTDDEQIRLYLMGTCMGAILQQRGIIPLHGSCVCNGEKSLVITGNSGAGKSTTAAEFLKRGWSLMSDDVTPIVEENGVYYACSTYPGQKMWQDTIDRSENADRVVKNIIREEDGRQKFQLQAKKSFINTTKPLMYGVYLIPGSEKLMMDEVTGFAKTDMLMRNLYRAFMVGDKQGKSSQLKTCVKLGEQMRLFIVARPADEYTETKIVDWLLEQMEREDG